MAELRRFNAAAKGAFIIFVDDHCFSHETWDAHFTFIHEQYFPRVAFGPVPLSSKKTAMFQTEMEAIGIQLQNGHARPGEAYRNRFKEWAERWKANPPATWAEVSSMLYVTPWLRKWIPGRADLVRRVKEVFFEEINKTTEGGKASVQREWVERQAPE